MAGLVVALKGNLTDFQRLLHLDNLVSIHIHRIYRIFKAKDQTTRSLRAVGLTVNKKDKTALNLNLPLDSHTNCKLKEIDFDI